MAVTSVDLRSCAPLQRWSAANRSAADGALEAARQPAPVLVRADRSSGPDRGMATAPRRRRDLDSVHHCDDRAAAAHDEDFTDMDIAARFGFEFADKHMTSATGRRGEGARLEHPQTPEQFVEPGVAHGNRFKLEKYGTQESKAMTCRTCWRRTRSISRMKGPWDPRGA